MWESQSEAEFKRIKQTLDYVCRYYPKTQSSAFLQKDTDNYRSDNPWVVSQLLPSVYTIWHGWNNSTNTNRGDSHLNFPNLLLITNHKNHSVKQSPGAVPRSWRTQTPCSKTNSHFKCFTTTFCLFWLTQSLFIITSEEEVPLRSTGTREAFPNRTCAVQIGKQNRSEHKDASFSSRSLQQLHLPAGTSGIIPEMLSHSIMMNCCFINRQTWFME